MSLAFITKILYGEVNYYKQKHCSDRGYRSRDRSSANQSPVSMTTPSICPRTEKAAKSVRILINIANFINFPDVVGKNNPGIV